MLKLLVTLSLIGLMNLNADAQEPWKWSDDKASILQPLLTGSRLYDVSVTNPKSERRNMLNVKISSGGETLCQWESHGEGAFVFAKSDSMVVYSQYSPIASGCRLVAFSLSDKKQMWQTDLKGIGPVEHSKYRNRINLILKDDRLIVYGNESSGKYIEVVDLNSGETISNRQVPFVGFDGQELEYEKLVTLANSTGAFQVAVSDCDDPGIERDGKPWSGTFVSRSHKTDLIIEKYQDGKRHGSSVGFDSPTIHHWIVTYDQGEMHGTKKVWNSEGVLWTNSVYEHGKRISENGISISQPQPE